MENFSWVDYAFVTIFAASALAGLVRGVIKEVMALVTWIAAVGVGTMFSSPLAAKFTHTEGVQSVVSSASSAIGANTAAPVSYMAIGGSFVVLFCGTLFVGSIISYLITRATSATGLGIANHLFGGIFGLARGFVIGVVAVFLGQMTALAGEAAWTQSQFVHTLEPYSASLANAVAPGLDLIKNKVGSAVQGATGGVTEMLNGATGGASN